MGNSRPWINADRHRLASRVRSRREIAPIDSLDPSDLRVGDRCLGLGMAAGVHEPAPRPRRCVLGVQPTPCLVPRNPGRTAALGNRPGDPDGGDLSGVELPGGGTSAANPTSGLHSLESKFLGLRLRPGAEKHLGTLSPLGVAAARRARSISRCSGLCRLVHGSNRGAHQDREVFSRIALSRVSRRGSRISARNPSF